MAGPAIQIHGLNELRNAIKKLPGRMDIEMAKAGQDWLDRTLVPAIRRRAPRRTGRLAGSVRALRKIRAVTLAVGTEVRVPYAGPINFGWPARNIRAQEFIYSTIAAQGSEWEKSYIDALDRWLGEAFPEGRL